MNDNYWAESKNIEVLVNQIGQNTKIELFPHKMSHTCYLKRASRYWLKEANVILLGVFLSTTESYYIHKTINLGEQ